MSESLPNNSDQPPDLNSYQLIQLQTIEETQQRMDFDPYRTARERGLGNIIMGDFEPRSSQEQANAIKWLRETVLQATQKKSA